ncbi:MAG TPA: wax ester/triacylglycerol synthase family O-acyltransferase [Dehalococcoidia bacterium]
MPGGSLDRRLGPEDYAFLLMDSDTEPANIGSVAIFEGDISLREFVENLESKLHLIPRYTQIVVSAPFEIGRPTWEADPHFDIHRHVHEVWLDAPGSQDQVLDFAAEVYSRQMDRSRPLWEMYMVKGLEGGDTALITVIHHCLVDGVGGVELAMVILDTVPNPKRVTQVPPVDRSPLPSRESLFFDAFFDDIAEGLERAEAWQKRFSQLLARQEAGWLRGLRSALQAAIPYFAMPVEKAPFNKKLSGRRQLAVSPFSLVEFRQIKDATGTTINDLALTVVGSAVGRYLNMHGQETEDRMLRVLMPVNVRKQDQAGRMGNRISFLVVEVPVGECTPLERLAAINENTTWLKTEHAGDGIEMIGEELLMLPTPLLKSFAAFGWPPNTISNMICTNVPGPPMPLYTVGHRLLSHYALAPISWEQGLSCTITSYDQEIVFTLVVDPEALPDVGRLKLLIDEAYEELRGAAGLEERFVEADTGAGVAAN